VNCLRQDTGAAKLGNAGRGLLRERVAAAYDCRIGCWVWVGQGALRGNGACCGGCRRGDGSRAGGAGACAGGAGCVGVLLVLVLVELVVPVLVELVGQLESTGGQAPKHAMMQFLSLGLHAMMHFLSSGLLTSSPSE